MHNPLSFQSRGLSPLIENEWFLDSNNQVTSWSHYLLVFATGFPVPTTSTETATAFVHKIPLSFAEEVSLLLQVTLIKPNSRQLELKKKKKKNLPTRTVHKSSPTTCPNSSLFLSLSPHKMHTYYNY